MTEQPDEPPPRRRGQPVETWVDQAIQQAQRRGDFDNLPGAGKPLRSLERPDDPDWWLKGLMERERIDPGDALPTALALRRERERYPQAWVEVADEAQVRELVADFNARVVEDRLRPRFGPELPVVVGRLDVEETVARWRELRARWEAERLPAHEQARDPVDPTRGEPRARRRRWWTWSR